jgi:hypothetical protein
MTAALWAALEKGRLDSRFRGDDDFFICALAYF